MKPVILGAHTFGLMWRYDVIQAIELLKELGFHQIEFQAAPGHLDIWAPVAGNAARLNKALLAAGSKAVAIDISTNDFNLASLWPEAAEFAIQTYTRLIDLAAEIGCGRVTIHGGRRTGLAPAPGSRSMDALRRAFDRLVTISEKRDVRLMIENIPSSFLNNAQAMNDFITAGGWQSVGILYDVANGAAAGDDPAVALAQILPRVAMVHLSDTPKSGQKHDPIGAGAIDFASIWRTLANGNYDQGVVMEICSDSPGEDLARGKEALERLEWRFSPGR